MKIIKHYPFTSFEPKKKWMEYICKTCGRHFWRRPGYKSRHSHQTFCSKECNKPKKAGGKYFNKGYTYIYMPDHPFASNGFIPEHRLVLEKKLGRYLKKNELVHHINGIRSDNRIENIELRTKTNHPHGISLDEMADILKSAGYTVVEP